MTRRGAVPVREWLDGLELLGVRLGLESMRLIAGALDHPEHSCAIVHVAGTNGKGSVAAMLAHALTAAGHRTGRYTSPHLIDLEERVAIDGRPIAPPALDAALGRVYEAVGQLRQSGALAAEPTYFEVTTAAAFEVFRNAHVTIGVVEVGLGGRLDATNIVAPVMTAITPVDRDHEAQLGTTLAAIAHEKAGIIKAGVPVAVAAMPPEAQAVIEAVAAACGAPVVAPAAVVDVAMRSGRTQVTLATPRRRYGPLQLGLRGRHQVGNAALAVAVLEALDAAGTPVSASAIVTALEQVAWPARLDLIEHQSGRVLVDGAHNPAGARALAAYLDEVVPGGLPIVFGAMSDKAIAPMVAALASCARPLVLTRAPGARAADPGHSRAIARDVAPEVETLVAGEPADALRVAWERAPLIVVCGSLYLAGAVLSLLRSR